MRVLSLFSGIGGLDLGLERAGMSIVGFCEKDMFARKVLHKHWPNVPQHDDVITLKGMSLENLKYLPADHLANGRALRRRSVENEQGKVSGRGCLPLGSVNSPNGGLIEQPPGNKGWEEAVARDLARIGYYVSRLELSACSSGAPHRRRRVFFVANTTRKRCDAVTRFVESSATSAQSWPVPPRGTWRTSGAGHRRVDDGFPHWVDQLRVLGNAVVPQVAERIGRALMYAHSLG